MGFITSLLKFIIGLIALVSLTVGITWFAASFADGPWALIPGGAFSTGEVIDAEPDWNFVKDRQEVEFELVATGRSRTTWIMVADGRIFIPSGYMNSTLGKLWKQWPIAAEADGRAILRIDGKLYHRNLVRIHEDPALPDVLSETRRKYLDQSDIPEPLAEVHSGNLWVFEMVRP
ncbi:MAG: hypothetical protein P8L31_08040 [Pseudomonadales bacterium]|nr:hypothetical protein [Pseudomonadales bacterium]